MKPEITAQFGFSTPGGILAIAGNFGTKPGSVVASLKAFWGGSMQRTLRPARATLCESAGLRSR